MYCNSSLISPLPKITVQSRSYKVNSRITQMVKKMGKRRQMQILQERSQGFWMEDEVKISLDRIKLRSHKMKTLPLFLNPPQYKEFSDKKHQTFNKSMFQKKKNSYRYYLPQLNQMIKTRQSQTDSLIKAKRRKIIHLLVLCLNRRNLQKLYEALDIVLLASFYFQKDDQQRALKSICLSLISKLHHQIKSKNITINRKSKLNKRRKSLTVMNYHSRQNFMENFMLKLRKTKLVGQFSYADSKKHDLKFYKINAKCQVSIPKPQQLFGQSSNAKNYDFVAITVDDHTNMLPYQYPKSLTQKINQVQYRQMICKMNGLLFPQSKCYSLSSILKIFYLPFVAIFMLFLLFSILRTFVTSQIGRLVLICSIIICVLILGIKISKEQSGYTNYIEIKDKMKEYLNEWEQKYEHLNLKFRMGDNVDAIFIVFPTQMPDSSQASSTLTQIQEVDENYTEGNTQSKYNKTDKGTRRTGGRFQDNGNLMKISTFNKFANADLRLVKRQNTVNNELQNQSKKNQQQNDRTLSEKKIKEKIQNVNNFFFDQVHSIQSHFVHQSIPGSSINRDSGQTDLRQQNQKQEKQRVFETSILKSKSNKDSSQLSKSKSIKSIKFKPDVCNIDLQTKENINKKKQKMNKTEYIAVQKPQQKIEIEQTQLIIQANKVIPTKKLKKGQLLKRQDVSETHLVTPQSNQQNIGQKKSNEKQSSRFVPNLKIRKQKNAD